MPITLASRNTDNKNGDQEIQKKLKLHKSEDHFYAVFIYNMFIIKP